MSRYIEILGLLHPGVEADATGTNYNDITWKDQVISKSTLDTEIAAIRQHRLNVRSDRVIAPGTPMRALVKWIAPLVGKTRQEALAEVRVILKTLA